MEIEHILFKVLSFLLLVALLFVAPLYNMLLRQDIMIQQMVYYSVEKLTDSVRECGYLTKNMYEEFCYELISAGTDYKVTMKHYQKQYFEREGELEADYVLYSNEEMLDEINKNNIYYVQKGDLFAVEVLSQDYTLGMNISYMLMGNEPSPIYARAGGMVLNENN